MDATPVFKVDYTILTFIHAMLDTVNDGPIDIY